MTEEDEQQEKRRQAWEEMARQRLNDMDPRELASKRREHFISDRNERKRKAFQARADYMMSLTPGEYLMGRALGIGAAIWETTPFMLGGAIFADMIHSYRSGKRFGSLIESARFSAPYVGRMWFRLTGYVVVQQMLEMWIMKQTRLGERYDPDPWTNVSYMNGARAVAGAGAGFLVSLKGRHGFTVSQGPTLPKNRRILIWTMCGAAAGPIVTDVCTFSLRSISYAWSSISSSSP